MFGAVLQENYSLGSPLTIFVHSFIGSSVVLLAQGEHIHQSTALGNMLA